MTREEFIKEYKSAHINWADDACPSDISEPTEAKVRQGWVVEQPRHTLFNWHMNRTDRRIRELEARVAWLEKCLAEKI